MTFYKLCLVLDKMGNLSPTSAFRLGQNKRILNPEDAQEERKTSGRQSVRVKGEKRVR